MKHFFNLCVKLTKLENMKSLLIIFAALQLFIQHREWHPCPNDIVFDTAKNLIGQKVKSGMCVDFVEECLDISTPTWRENAGYGENYMFEIQHADSIIDVPVMGRLVEHPSKGDIIFLKGTECDHIGIFVEQKNDTIFFLDQNAFDRTGDNSYVDFDTYTKSDTEIIVFMRPL